jgi:hypothetical protein
MGGGTHTLGPLIFKLASYLIAYSFVILGFGRLEVQSCNGISSLIRETKSDFIYSKAMQLSMVCLARPGPAHSIWQIKGLFNRASLRLRLLWRSPAKSFSGEAIFK